MSSETEIKKMVVEGYSYPTVVKAYTDDAINCGLWGVEDILIKKYFEKGASVLDIGCGAGREAVPLAEQGFKVTGIDISQKMIDSAISIKKTYGKNLDNLSFKLMDVSDLKFPENYFDNVLFIFNGIDFSVPKSLKMKVLGNIFRILKPGGYFILSSHTLLVSDVKDVDSIYLPPMTLPGNLITFFLMKLFFQKRLEEGKEFFYTGKKNPESDSCGKLESTYLHRMYPSGIIRMLKNTGFELVYCNSRFRIEDNKRPPVLIDLRKEEDFVYYVAKKL